MLYNDLCTPKMNSNYFGGTFFDILNDILRVVFLTFGSKIAYIKELKGVGANIKKSSWGI